MSQQTTTLGTIPEWTLGWRMQRALTHAGVSVQAMADELGVARSTISRWINDHGAPPRSAFISQWAMRTGVDPDWLRYGIEHPNGPRTPRDQEIPSSSCYADTPGHASLLAFPTGLSQAA